MSIAWTDEARRSGISQPIVKKQVVQSPADLDAVAEVFEHIAVVPDPAGYAADRVRIGDRGLAVAQGTAQASPAHVMLHNAPDAASAVDVPKQAVAAG